MEAAIKIWEQCPQPIKDSVLQSPMLIVVLIVVYFCYNQLASEHKAHIKSKDDEIERLVKEKNALQKEFLKQRLTTADEPKKK